MPKMFYNGEIMKNSYFIICPFLSFLNENKQLPLHFLLSFLYILK